jgi:hypothetical protein
VQRSGAAALSPKRCSNRQTVRKVGAKIPLQHAHSQAAIDNWELCILHPHCTPLIMGEKYVTSRRGPSLIHPGEDSGFGASQLTLTFPLHASMIQNLKAGPGRFQPCLEEKISIIDSSWMA